MDRRTQTYFSKAESIKNKKVDDAIKYRKLKHKMQNKSN